MKVTAQTQAVIDRLEAMSKEGKAYDGGKQNPIRKDTGELLYALTLAARPFLALEVGAAFGLSGCYIAAALNGAGSCLHTLEFDHEAANAAQQNFEEAGLKVVVYEGDAMKLIACLQRRTIGKYGLVFLDAKKSDYIHYLLELQNRDMLMPKATIIADNVLDRADEVTEFMAYMQQFQHTVIPTECGLLVAQMP